MMRKAITALALWVIAIVIALLGLAGVYIHGSTLDWCMFAVFWVVFAGFFVFMLLASWERWR